MRIAALDIGGTAIKHCLYDDRRQFSRDIVQETETNALAGGVALMEHVCGIVETMGGADAIAVSTAGQVNPTEGSIIYATDNIPGYTGTMVKAILEDHFHIPAVVENDVNAAALGEAFFGAGRGCSDFLCLTYGTGIGGAIVSGQKIYYGSSCSAGEFGHILTHAGGRKCTCGNCGCYEAYASTRALTRLVKENCGLDMNGRQIFQAINGSKPVRDAVSVWIDEIVYGLVSLIHAFNPQRVVLGGGIMNEPYITETIRRKLPEKLMQSYRGVEIRRAELGNTAGLFGVIHLAEDGRDETKTEERIL